MKKIDTQVWQTLMDETTSEDAEQATIGVYLDPEKDGLPVLHDKKKTQESITSMQKGFKHIAQGIAETS